MPAGIYERTAFHLELLKEARSRITEEARKRGWDALRGRKHSEEHRRKISEASKLSVNSGRFRKGQKHGKMNEETRKKIGDAHRGKKASDETKKKLSESHIGNRHSEETKKKMRETRGKMENPSRRPDVRKILRENNARYWLGVPMSEERKRKISDSHKKKVLDGTHKSWKGGITKYRRMIRELLEYRLWRTSIFERDKYKCVLCNNGGELQVDHIKAFAIILAENRVRSLEEAIACNELWDTNNGRTLCKPCHLKTENFGSKALKKKPSLLLGM